MAYVAVVGVALRAVFANRGRIEVMRLMAIAAEHFLSSRRCAGSV
jgi:hypothetical protein